MENIFPSVVSEWLLARDPTSVLDRTAVFQRCRTPTGMNELSQQPSTDFGCRALQMQKRRFLVLIFTGCEQHMVPNELSEMQFKGAGVKSETGDNDVFFIQLFIPLLI